MNSTLKSERSMTEGLARKELREYQHNKSRLQALESGLNLNFEYSPSDCERLRAKLEFIEACLNQLQPVHRETIELVFFKKLKYREYERLKRLSKSGAEDRIKRAVTAFEKLFLLKN